MALYIVGKATPQLHQLSQIGGKRVKIGVYCTGFCTACFGLILQVFGITITCIVRFESYTV